jgi:hypothetical protein
VHAHEAFAVAATAAATAAAEACSSLIVLASGQSLHCGNPRHVACEENPQIYAKSMSARMAQAQDIQSKEPLS